MDKFSINISEDKAASLEAIINPKSVEIGNLRNKFIKPKRWIYREADTEYDGVCKYLPHRPVIKTDAKTTTIRPVFDGSAHQKNKPSLNDMLETGPNLNPEILAVLLRFRQKKVAFTADISQAFLQIGIQQEHEQIVKFFW